MKPRVYWCYYPKLERGFWRVSAMPRKLSSVEWWRWKYAYEAVTKTNNKLVRKENADQVAREMRRQSD